MLAGLTYRSNFVSFYFILKGIIGPYQQLLGAATRFVLGFLPPILEDHTVPEIKPRVFHIMRHVLQPIV